MNKQFQGFIAGVLATIILFSGALYAKSTVERIEVSYNNIQVYKDNVLQSLKDAQGNSIEPFVYQGTTYVPLRAAAELAGMQVRWDGASKSIYLTGGQNQSSQPAAKVQLLDVCRPQEGKDFNIHEEGINLNGQQFSKGISLTRHLGYVFFNLNSQYTQLELSAGIKEWMEKNPIDNCTIDFYLDGKLVYSLEIKSTDTQPHKITIPLNNASTLEIYTPKYSYWGIRVGLGDITVY